MEITFLILAAISGAITAAAGIVRLHMRQQHDRTTLRMKQHHELETSRRRAAFLRQTNDQVLSLLIASYAVDGCEGLTAMSEAVDHLPAIEPPDGDTPDAVASSPPPGPET